ncbi:hypothetical protein [Nitrosomonas communis]|uniref:hypothetical protein n=1 Tax=Nitrosomonas communis TaxID=44574 RepID=UPI003D28FF1C
MIDLNSSKPSLAVHSNISKAENHPEMESFVLLRDGRVVPKRLYDRIRTQVEKALPFLNPNRKYTAKKLCGRKFWDEYLLFADKQRLAGRCLANMVVRNELPLEFVELTTSFSRSYQLK